MDPKLTELFNQLRLTFEHFAEAMDQANPPASTPLPGSPSDAAVQTGPAPGPVGDRNDDLPENMSEMADEELNERLSGKKKTSMPKM